MGGFRILAELGRGGMGIVYEAEPLALPGARYALKVLLAADERARERFRREGALLGKVDRHPNIVRVHATGEDRGRPFLVLDLVEGESLEAVIARGPLPWRKAIDMIEPIAGALHAIHALGIVHRDLKPSNILVDRDGRPRLTDFGVALDEDHERLTRTGNTVGTLAYLAPELLQGTHAADARSDIWALGICLHEALTGRHPFFADSFVAIARKIEAASLEPPSRLASGIPPSVDRIVLRALARAPGARFETARDMELALRAARADRDGGRRPLRLLALVLAAGGLAGTAAVVWPAAPEGAPSKAELTPYAEALDRASGELASGKKDFARKHAESVLADLAPGRDEARRALVDRARAIVLEAAQGSEARPGPAGDPSAALQCIDRARQARGRDDPEHYEVWDDLAPLVRHAEEVHSSLAEARRKAPAVELPSDLVAFVAGVAKACSKKTRNDDALRFFQDAVELDPTDAASRLEIARIHTLQSDLASGREQGLAVLALARATPEQRIQAYGYAIDGYNIRGEGADAEKLLEQGLAEFPEAPGLLLRVAWDALWAKDGPRALDAARRALARTAPGTDDYHNVQRVEAEALDLTGEYGAALAALREVHGPAEWSDQDLSSDLLEEIRAHVGLGHRDEAERLVPITRRAIAREGGSEEPRKKLADLEERIRAIPR
jgi:hypothetical protein